MVVLNLFIAFFVIIALSVSWLAFNLVFNDKKKSPRTDEPTIAAPPTQKGATCREQVVEAAKAVTIEKGVNEFAATEIVAYLIETGTGYSVSTIRTHVASRCCVNASNPDDNGDKHFERVERGKYRLVRV